MGARTLTGRTSSIRRRLGAVLTALGVLVGGLIVVTTLQLRASSNQTKAENRRNRSFQLADSMRQSSNDLTRMVRLYVSTGEPRYRGYYDEILAIRAGESRRPLHYDSSFWDRVLAEGKASVEYGERESLVDQMRVARFTDEEFNALDASLRASDKLALLELDVMTRVGPRIAQGVDGTYLADVGPEYARLVDQAYLVEKGVIMRSIDDFIARVEARTIDAVERARTIKDALLVVQIVILGFIVLVGIGAMVRTRRIVLRPLGELADATEHFAAGDYNERVAVRGVAELETLAAAFNSMATAVESDVGRRERAESEAIQARAAAEEANRAKSTFVAAMSHEIRTPMIGVTGMLEVLAQTELGPEQHSMVGTALGSAELLLQIIGDILDFSKIEAGKLELAPGPLMVRPLAETAVQTFVHTASAKGVRLTVKVDDNVAPAHVGDALRIRQILSNFLSNAVKFTSSGSIALMVRVLADDAGTQSLEFAVADTGIGVAPERQQELFQEFVQADASTASRSGGTGLGLVICRRLAALMDGAVRMESELGRGTTMYFEVPLRVADPASVEAGPGARALLKRPKPSREVAEREGSLLLLAEDHPINRRVLVHQLGIIGFHVDTAKDGREALDLFMRGRYGLVLTDLNMPTMDGFELTRAIRAHDSSAGVRTPIVALSANVMAEEVERCMTAGMDDFAGKPASMPALVDILRRWLPHLTWPEDGAVSTIDLPAAEAVARDVGEVLDPAVLDELTGGDLELSAAILRDFVESSRTDVEELLAAFTQASPDEVRRCAHRIAGASRTVGATQIATRASELESAAAAAGHDWPALRAMADEIEAAVANVAQSVEVRR